MSTHALSPEPIMGAPVTLRDSATLPPVESNSRPSPIVVEYLQAYLSGAITECKRILKDGRSILPNQYWQGKIDAYAGILIEATAGELFGPLEDHQ